MTTDNVTPNQFSLTDEYLVPNLVKHIESLTGNAANPVLSFVTDFPYNVRCLARWAGGLRFRLTVSEQVAAQIPNGEPCCLLWHRHDDVLLDLASITVFGVAGRDADGVYLTVNRKPILSNVGPQDWDEAFRTFTRNSENYLRDYGLEEPDLNWPVLEQLATEAMNRYGDPDNPPEES